MQTKNYKWNASDLLGKGAFGYVYSGIGKNNRKVAIKTFQFTLKSFIKREAAIMEIANHQNIVNFLGLEEIDGSNELVIIMELCGRNLQELIDESPNGLDSARFIPFCQHLISAEQYLRSINVIHRDIKPGNILLSHQAGHIIYKLADFGAARLLKTNESYGSLYGTYEYIHPDIFAKYYGKLLKIPPPKQAFKDYHELWSLGVTIFEVASGKLPFRTEKGRKDPKTMYDMIANKENDCISAEEINGKIEWFRQLPENCDLDHTLRQTVTQLLAALLQSSDVMSFEQFFEMSSSILSLRNITSPVKNVQHHAKNPKHIQKHRQVSKLSPSKYRRGSHHPWTRKEVQWWRRQQKQYFGNSHYLHRQLAKTIDKVKSPRIRRILCKVST